ncbi:MAG: sugar ABC transporter permease [Firmicutes bacterium]|nr:sugar ABC transporter permease [Bacillota bacterium]
MEKLSFIEYQGLGTFQRILYNIRRVLAAIPAFFARIGKAAGRGIKAAVFAIGRELKSVVMTLITGSWRTKLSYLIMGFGNLTCGQIVRGAAFLLFEIVFIWYTVTTGAGWMSKLGTLGDVQAGEVYDAILDTYVRVGGDDSFKILLYGGLSVVFCIAAVIVWWMSIKQSKANDELIKSGKHPQKFKADIHDLVDAKFHKTLLAVPLIGILLFTVLPIVFMIVVAFTNYDGAHDGFSNLFTWVGWKNFAELFNTTDSNLNYAFRHILGWTLVWAFFATFSNYFLGIVVALLINKKGIKFKKMWRGILVMTSAVPQFISLLYMSKLFAKNGLVNGFLVKLGILTAPFDFWGTASSARILVILINVWIGIPYLMLIATGILMNIPEDLYESAKIDGANPVQAFVKITLPYMLFITGPYLLTSFIGNINNFNVIFLLTGGAISDPKLTVGGTSATDTDLLITWLYKITTGADSNYKLASVVGILIFIVVAVLSLIVYNVLPSNKNEEDFQ